MLTVTGWRDRLAARRGSAGTHIEASLRAVENCLGGAALLSAILLYLASAGSSPLVVALAALEFVAVLAAFGMVRIRRGVLRRVIALPLAELADASQYGPGRRRTPQTNVRPATDIEQLSDTVNRFRSELQGEQRRRAADASAEQDRSSSLQQTLRITESIGATLDLDEVMAAIGEAARRVSGYGHARVWLLNLLGRGLDLRYDSAAPEDAHAITDPEPLGEGGLARAVASGHIVTLREDPATPARETGLIVPIRRGLEVVSLVELGGPRENAGVVEIIDTLETLASRSALAIQASQLHEEVERRSETDGLTKVLNRRRLDADIRGEVNRSLRYGHALALVMVDVDHFKSINDEFGHQQGDEVLKVVGATLQRECRTTDGAYRFGGEEFALLLRDTGVDDAADVAERLRQRLPLSVSAVGLRRPITASLGVSAISEQVRSAEQLIQAADAALYEAKRGGRNRVVVSPLT